MTYEINEINSADIEWMGGCMEDDAGYLKYSAVHAWIGDETLCGATPRGEITDVSHGNECKRCLKKVAKIEALEVEVEAEVEAEVEPVEIEVEAEPVVNIDDLIAHNSGFSSLDDMLNARGGYRPSCDVSRLEMELIADAYDAAQAARGDERRAFRY
jgi:hypothetical protein